MREKIHYEYTGKGGQYIKTSTLDKAEKGHYKNDLIRLKIKAKTTDFDVYLTPKEAIIISGALNLAVIGCKKQDKGLLQ